MPLSPMMQQYQEIKERYSDSLLLYRLGDFYELFFRDAEIASRELELTLTGRNCGLAERAPMCGVPFHAADSYIAKLVERGYTVAICEQTEDPSTAKGIVRREVTRVITPGTLDLLTESEGNRFIASLAAARDGYALAYADVTTGEFYGMTLPPDADSGRMLAELSRIRPRELLFAEGTEGDWLQRSISGLPGSYIHALDAAYYRDAACEQALCTQFHLRSLIPLGLDGHRALTSAAGALLLYLTDTEMQRPAQIQELRILDTEDGMLLDRATIQNLELLETQYDKRVQGSLLGLLDKSKTAMGGRLLRSILQRPLHDPAAIRARLDAVERLAADPALRCTLIASLREIYDFERLTARVASGRANAKDLIALKQTLAALPALLEALAGEEADLLRQIAGAIDDFSALHDAIDTAIVEEPPYLLTEGGLIRSGYAESLDKLKDSIREAKEWISSLEQREKERSGIKTLKVGYNKVFGYYIDVSKSQLDAVPEDYIRKQTLVNNERYITPELKEKESLVLSAEAKINAMEYELFKALRSSIEPAIPALQRASRAVALLDVLTAFAELAASGGYTRPLVDASDSIEIRDGRHPAVEAMLGEGLFVANDTLLDIADRSLLIITGPNMSGKSTYMRQTAIIVLMAQIGCFVPCSYAHIGVVDRIFTRIGAADNLSRGQSTFYIEMSELANILRHATGRSLILLDEIGRGTSTFDGLSIAWATIEHLCREGQHIRTMFATHYHELTELSERYPSVHNLSVAVAEEGREVVFLHQIQDGPASKSYGIQVAKIAGIPSDIRRSAARKLRELETKAANSSGANQLSFFELLDAAEGADAPETSEEGEAQALPAATTAILEELETADLNELTPMAALLMLQRWQERLQHGEQQDGRLAGEDRDD